MKNIDGFTVLMLIAIALNGICMLAQGGWWIVIGVVFNGFWAWVAYWDWRHKRVAKMLDAVSRLQGSDTFALSNILWQIGTGGFTVNETVNALNSLGDHEVCRRYRPQYVGDVTCRNNAKSPHLQCAINPLGSCSGCVDYTPI